MKIIAVGGGKTLYFLAKSLVSKGHSVTIVNKDEGYSEKLARQLMVRVVYGNGTDPKILEDAGARLAGIVVAVTGSDPDNLVICQVAETMFGVPRTLAIVNDPNNKELFESLGVNSAVSTVEMVSSMIEQNLDTDDVKNFFPVGEGKVVIMEVDVKEGYPVVDKRIMDIDFPEGSLVGCILRNGEAHIPRGLTMVRAGDKLILITLPLAQSKAVEAVCGFVE